MAAPTEEATGSQTASISTEHTLDTVAGTGSFGLAVELANLALGDVVVLRAYIDESDGTLREFWAQRYSHAVGAINALSPPFPCFRSAGLKFTLEQEAGTGRVFEWTVFKYA